jgi:hypothetical protein
LKPESRSDRCDPLLGIQQPFTRFSFAWLNERELREAVRRMAAARP